MLYLCPTPDITGGWTGMEFCFKYILYKVGRSCLYIRVYLSFGCNLSLYGAWVWIGERF
jgi:hypothetical protein